MNFDITKLKCVFFDFDDTLCIHVNHSKRDQEMYNRAAVAGDTTWYETGFTNKQMQEFIALCTRYGVKMCLISAVANSQRSELKLKWVLENYGVEMENFCVGDWAQKKDMLLTLLQVENLRVDNVMIVDDNVDVLADCANHNLQACSPMEIVNYMNSYNINKANEVEEKQNETGV